MPTPVSLVAEPAAPASSSRTNWWGRGQTQPRPSTKEKKHESDFPRPGRLSADGVHRLRRFGQDGGSVRVCIGRGLETVLPGAGRGQDDDAWYRPLQNGRTEQCHVQRTG